MKCNECKYHDNDEVCENECGRAIGLIKPKNKEPCYEDRARAGMGDDTCVWNCDFCRANREIKEA